MTLSANGATRLSRRFAASLIAAVALVTILPLHGMAFDAELQKLLAPSGKLRAALYTGTPTSLLSANDSNPKGVGYELGKALAQRLGVPYEPVVFAKNNDVLDAVKSGNADVAFTNASAARAKIMDFSQPYLEIELGYLVPKDSRITAIGDVDTKGKRIGVTTGSSSDGVLSRDLHNVEIVRIATFPMVLDMLSKNEIDAFATNKATLFKLSEKVPGSRVLDGQWGAEHHAIAIPKGRDAGLSFVRAFTADAMAQGLVAGAIERSGLRGTKVVQTK